MSLLKRPRSVRVRLTLAYVAAMMAVLAVYAGVVYMSVRGSMSQALDAKLLDDFGWPKDMIVKDTVQQLLSGEFKNSVSITGDGTDGASSLWKGVRGCRSGTRAERNVCLQRTEARSNLIPDAAQLATNADKRIRTLPDTVPPYRILTGKTQVAGVDLVIQVAASEGPMRAHLDNLLFILLLGLPARGGNRRIRRLFAGAAGARPCRPHGGAGSTYYRPSD